MPPGSAVLSTSWAERDRMAAVLRLTFRTPAPALGHGCGYEARDHAISNSSRGLSTNVRLLRGSPRPRFNTITEVQWCQRPDCLVEASFCDDAQSSEAVGFPLALKRFLYWRCDSVHATAILQPDGTLPGLGSLAGSAVLLGT
ncbi:hypothetical protein F5144DRAFT_588897 [Chaetomium tenue]|uniref:Uncharacterized protein n=1 Tax=Chaetomium tenue TaxID=1854479 RepID=A0ACB7PQ50_9PEZI|nr:hypothetical protein F5144DRAFT_588897 [Chaetomium globosum]